MVAFANKGAKDVTQRYVGSSLAADRMRDNAWWDETLKPLRKHEVDVLLSPMLCWSYPNFQHQVALVASRCLPMSMIGCTLMFHFYFC